MSRRSQYAIFVLTVSLAAMAVANARLAPPFVARLFASGPAPPAPAASWRAAAGEPIVRAAGLGAPWLGFEDGLAVPAAPAKALATDATFSAATGDFDGDGVRDLVTGHAGP